MNLTNAWGVTSQGDVVVLAADEDKLESAPSKDRDNVWILFHLLHLAHGCVAVDHCAFHIVFMPSLRLTMVLEAMTT